MYKMNTAKNFVFISSIALLATACCTSSTETTPAQELIAQIETGVQSNVIMLGHQDSPLYGHSWKYEPNRSDVLETVGDYPAVMGWEIGGLELGQSESLDGVPFDLIRTEIANQYARGGINTISWHTFRPDNLDSWEEEAGIVTSILEGGDNYELFQQRLEIVANYLLSLKDADGKLIPIIFRPWHEHNGNWFWWGDKWCTHDEYIALWDMTHDFMSSRGLNNLVWCYMPMEGAPDKTPAADKFDMVGIDVYQQNEDVEKYVADLKSRIAMLKEYKEQYAKPIALTETGSETLPTENWFSEVLLPAIEGEPISYVLLWRNAHDKPDHFYCSFKGHSSEEDFCRFVASPSIITVKDVEKFTKNSL